MSNIDPRNTPRTVHVHAPPPELQSAAADPGKHLDKYVLLEVIGEGGMGTVYRAWDTALNRIVALKILKPDTTPSDLARFVREAQLAASLSHPNIAAVYDVGEHQGRHFIAMQFIDGRALQGARFSPIKAAEHVRTAAMALHAAHGMEIVHRDVKPGNMMLDKGDRLYVMDFGIAKSIQRAGGTITQEGIALGTPSYMSPEQARGMLITSKSDIYSLGATLFDMTTGVPPYDGATPMDIVMKIVSADPPAPSELNRSIPRALELVMMKAMSRQPNDRYETAQAMAEDLDRFLRGEPVLAEAPSISTRMRAILHRNRSSLAGAAGGVTLAAALLAWFIWSMGQSGRIERTLQDADTAYAASRWDDALALYNQAQALNPKDTRIAGRLEDCRKRAADDAAGVRRTEELQKQRAAAAGPLEQGKEKLEQAERDLYRRRADLPASRAKAGEAIEAFDRALALCPDHPEALLHRGRARLLRLEFDGAEADFTRAIGVSPNYAPALILRGRLHMRRFIDMTLDAGSVGYLRGAALKRADDARGLARADFAAAASVTPPDKRDFLEALVAYSEQRWMDAIEFCNRLLAAGSTDEEVHKLRGDSLFFGSGVDSYRRINAEGERILQDAHGAYSHAIEQRANFPEALAMRGFIRTLLGRVEDQRSDLDAALTIDRTNFLALIMNATYLSDRGDLQAALRAFDDALAAKPDSYFARVNRAVVHAKLGQMDKALEGLDDAIQVNPDHAWALQLKGSLLGRGERLEEADALLTRAAELLPTLATIWRNRASVRLKLGRRADAIADLKKAIELGHPESDQLREIVSGLEKE